MKSLLFFLFLLTLLQANCRIKPKSYNLIVEVYSVDKTVLKGYQINFNDSIYITDFNGRIHVKFIISGYDLSRKKRKMLNLINPKYLVFEYGSFKYFLKNNWRKIQKGKKENKVYKIYFPILFRKK